MPRATPPNNPSRRHRAPRLLTSIVAVAALACGGLAVGGAASAAPAGSAAAGLKLTEPLRTASPGTTVSAFVRTTGAGALEVDAQAKGGDLSRSKAPSSAAKSRLATIRSTNAKVLSAVKGADREAAELYSTAYTVPGVAVVADAAAFAELAKRSDVLSIAPLLPKKVVEPERNPSADAAPSGVDPDLAQPGADGVAPKNAASDLYTKAHDAWTQTGHTGEGVNVAVIDTGLDYTQADFGGPGTRAAYQEALASTGTPASSWYDPSKYLGGHDFAGPTYNADPRDPDTYDPVPAPDANPIDGKGGDHGTHVAGTAAGYGLNADKTTFRGDHTTLTPQQVQDMWVGPGSAPQAGLYALKVFGDQGGSTDLTGAALDWVGQSLTEGRSIDVINLSLGSDYGAADDPDNAKIDALTARGVLPVIAAGNAEDFTDVGGSPGNAAGALTVAAAATGQSLFDGVEATAPADVAKTWRGQYSQQFQGALPVEGDVVVPTTNIDGCAAFSADQAAAITGKIVWLKWTDGALECGSGVRFRNVEAAGGIGVLLAGTVNTFDSGIAGNTTIPGAELTRDSVAGLQAAARAGTLHVRFADELRGFEVATDADTVNTLASFTSRGDHGSYGDVVKPDIAGPGVNVVSAANGTGNDRLSMSGTSMATPHVAGVAALAFEAHPGWSAPEIKAALMNTATHDVRQSATDGQSATLLRQGTGRVDALQVVQDGTTVRSQENGQLVTASFGVVEVSAATTEKRTLLVRNTTAEAHTYRVAYESRIAQPGVVFTLSADTVTVPAGGTATVTLTMTIADPTLLRKVIDPTQAAVESGTQREFVPAATGLVTFTPAADGVTPLRLGVYAAPEPVSALHADDVVFEGKARTSTITSEGRGLSQGTGATGYQALVAPFQLGGTDPKESFPDGTAKQTLGGADIRAFGANSTALGLADRSKGLVSFGVQTDGADANPGASNNVEVLIDTNRDGEPDYLTYDRKSATVDATVVETIDLHQEDPEKQVVDTRPLGGVAAGVDVNTFDSAVKVLPVSLAALGYTAKSTSAVFDYAVVTESAYSPTLPTAASSVVDDTKTVTYNAFQPAVSFTANGASSLTYPDTSIKVVRASASSTSAKVLLLHLHNAPGDQADVLSTTSVTPKLALVSGRVAVTGSLKVGTNLRSHTGTWNTDGITFTYKWLRDGKDVGISRSTYKVGSKDVGHKISFVLTAKKSGYESTSITSPQTGTITR
ncbi:S8 family serine peptidase [Curtobacterium sp. MCSS17_015]|uniref:S8 family serine peptidase n=1 Tax=Curtobacterium sp. MCSS17_015 TaxID=2175666 RepID=UPI0011B54CD9|nr:S8 family serine peptidase [Curtobacterium sp. MCSS17_015]WIB26982.1 S8 family serine peptidase [Curtobacterium sp. MCSS17_015]